MTDKLTGGFAALLYKGPKVFCNACFATIKELQVFCNVFFKAVPVPVALLNPQKALACTVWNAKSVGAFRFLLALRKRFLKK
jgi:hypothetical protein